MSETKFPLPGLFRQMTEASRAEADAIADAAEHELLRVVAGGKAVGTFKDSTPEGLIKTLREAMDQHGFSRAVLEVDDEARQEEEGSDG